MPLGAFRQSQFLANLAPSFRSWDVYDGSDDSIEFELTDFDVNGSTSCVVDGKLITASLTTSVSATTINVRLFALNTDNPNNYSVTLLDSTTITSGANINPRFLRMTRLETDKVIFFNNAYSNGQETVVISTANNSLSLGNLQFHNNNTAQSQVTNGGGIVVLTPEKVIIVGGQNRSIALYTISGNTVTYQATINTATLFSNTPRLESWVTKINNDRILIVSAYNKTGSSNTHLEDLNAAILDVSNNTFSTVTIVEGIATTSTNDFYSWGSFGRGFYDYNESTGVILTNQRTVNTGRADQTKSYPGTAVIKATATTITGHSASDSWAYEFDNILKSNPNDFTSGSPSVPTVADHPYTCFLKENYWLVFMRSCNNISRETDESYHQVHILKQDNLTVAPPTDSRYAPQLVYSKPQGAYLFDFDNALAHKIDEDTAVVTYNKGRLDSTTAPNGRVACKIIKAPLV